MGFDISQCREALVRTWRNELNAYMHDVGKDAVNAATGQDYDAVADDLQSAMSSCADKLGLRRDEKLVVDGMGEVWLDDDKAMMNSGDAAAGTLSGFLVLSMQHETDNEWEPYTPCIVLTNVARRYIDRDGNTRQARHESMYIPLTHEQLLLYGEGEVLNETAEDNCLEEFSGPAIQREFVEAELIMNDLYKDVDQNTRATLEKDLYALITLSGLATNTRDENDLGYMLSYDHQIEERADDTQGASVQPVAYRQPKVVSHTDACGRSVWRVAHQFQPVENGRISSELLHVLPEHITDIERG